MAVTNGDRQDGDTATAAYRESDLEVTVATLDEDLTVQVEQNGRLVAAENCYL